MPLSHSNMSNFSNPYLTPPGQPPVPTCKLGLFVSLEDYNYIKSLRLTHGTLTITANLLLHKLCLELAKHGFADFTTSDAFEHAVAAATIQLPVDCRQLPVDCRVAPGGLNGGQPQERLTGGDSGVCTEVSGNPVEQRSVEKPRHGGKRRRRGVGSPTGEAKSV